MKITILSYAYAPSLGGVESVSRLVADGLQARGHRVTVVTRTPGKATDEARVVRRPSAWRLIRELWSADAVVQSNVSVRLAWPLLLGLVRRRWVVVNHTPIARQDGHRSVRDWLKIASLPPNTYSVSRFLATTSRPRATRVIPNPYDDSIFWPQQVRQEPVHSLLFVGRIEPVKGVDLLLRALRGLVDSTRHEWRLTIVGTGSAEAGVRGLARDLGIAERVDFLGRLEGPALARRYSSHRILVLPSRRTPAEAFPLVPVEAASCGCYVVASQVGGMGESVGPNGSLVEPDSAASLARAIARAAAFLEANPDWSPSTSHLSEHSVERVAEAYSEALTTSYKSNGRRKRGAGGDGEPEP